MGIQTVSESSTDMVDHPSAVPASDHSGRHSSRHGHSSRRHRRHRTSANIILFVTGLVIVLVVFIIFASYLFLAGSHSRGEISWLQTQLDARETELREANRKIQDIEAEFAALVDQKLPHLQELSFDEVINVWQDFVKNIVFTQTHLNGVRTYEFRIVAENNNSKLVSPKFRVLLFDRSGVQIGGATEAGGALLRSGESTTFYDRLDIFIDAVPAYFYIDTDFAETPAPD